MRNAETWEYWRAGEDGLEDASPHKLIKPLVDGIKNDQAEIYSAIARYREAYGQMMLGPTFNAGRFFMNTKLTLNELANSVDTLHAMVYKNRVVPTPLTTGGSYKQFDEARKAARWMEGWFYEAKVHEERVPMVGLDALVAGTGIFKLVEEERSLCVERTLREDLYVDRLEAQTGKPLNFHERMILDRGYLYEQFVENDSEHFYGTKEDRERIIDSLEYKPSEDWRETSPSRDVVEIWVTHHLPLSKRDKSGRRIVWCEQGTLEFAPWKLLNGPYIFMRWGVPLDGFWGDSAVRRILPAQRALDKLTRRIDYCHDLMGVPRIFRRRGSRVAKGKIDDVPAAILDVDDLSDLKEWNAEPITPSAYGERDRLPNAMRSVLGISSMDTNMEIPAQMREFSGAAVERFAEQSNSRQAMNHRYYESAMVELGERALDFAYLASSEGRSVKVMAQNGPKFIEEIDFKEIDLARDQLRLRVVPVSNLPRTFSGRAAELGRQLDRGAISMSTYRRMLEVPDIEAENDLDIADEEIVRKVLEHMITKNEYIPPLPHDNLQVVIKMATKFVHMCRVQEVEESRVALVLKYIDDAVALVEMSQQQTPQAPPEQMPMGPGGAPMPAPDMGGMPGAMPMDMGGDGAMPMDMGGVVPPDGGGMPPPDMGGGGMPPMM